MSPFKYLVIIVYLIQSTAAFCSAHTVFKTDLTETRSVAVSDDGKIIAYAGYKRIYLIDAATQQSIRVIDGAPGDITDLYFSENRLAATGSKYVGFWNSKTGKIIRIINRDEYTYRFSVSSKAKTLFAGKKVIEGWDINTGKRIMKTAPLSKEAGAIGVSPDGKTLLISPKWGNSILKFDTKTGLQTGELKTISRATQIVFHPNGNAFFVKQFNKPVKEVSLSSSVLRDIGPNTVLGRMRLSKNKRYLLLPTWSTQRETEEVIVYSLAQKKVVRTLKVSPESIYSAEMTPDAQHVIAVTKDPFLHLIPFMKD